MHVSLLHVQMSSMLLMDLTHSSASCISVYWIILFPLEDLILLDDSDLLAYASKGDGLWLLNQQSSSQVFPTSSKWQHFPL